MYRTFVPLGTRQSSTMLAIFIMGAPAPTAHAPIIGGYGDFIFQYEPSRLVMPAGTSLNNAHGLVVDPLTNEIILTYEPNHDTDTHCMVRFKPDGTDGVTIGDGTGLCEGTPHGLRLSAEGSDLYLYHANNDATLHKTTLDGKLLWTVKGAPTIDPAFQPNKPTWFAAPPGSKFVYMADGYGSNYVHSYTHDGVYANYSFGGRGTDFGKFQTCHCINYDARVGKIIVTDRENHRHQYFDLNPTGGPQLTFSSVFTTPGLDRPCTHHVAPDGVHAVVPALEGPVGILDSTNALVSLVNVSGLLGNLGHLHPHDAIMLPSGDLVVATWAPGRLSYWRKLPKEQAEA